MTKDVDELEPEFEPQTFSKFETPTSWIKGIFVSHQPAGHRKDTCRMCQVAWFAALNDLYLGSSLWPVGLCTSQQAPSLGLE